jgi:O-antigen/teichoic acid export membrane protein
MPQNMLKAGFNYLILNIIARGVPILIAPLLISKIGIYGYGVFALCLTVESLMMPFVAFNTVSAVQAMFRFEASDKRLIFNCIAVNLIASTISFLAVSIIFWITPEWSKNKLNVVFLGFFGASFAGVANIIIVVCRLRMNIFGVALVQLTPIFTFIVLFVFSLVIDFSLNTFLWLRAMGNVIGVVVGVGYIWRRSEISLDYSWLLIGKIIKFCLPLVGASIVSLWASGIDRFFLVKHYSPEEVGKIAAVSQIVAILSVLASTVGATWIPWIIHLKASPEDFCVKKILRVGGRIVLFGVVCALISICFFPWFIKIYINKWPDQIALVVAIMVSSVFFELLYLISSPFALIAGKSGLTLLFSIVTAMISIAAMAILVPRYAAIGGIISTLIGWMTLGAQHLIYTIYYLKNYCQQDMAER